MSQTPLETRFCYVWKINSLPTRDFLKSNKFRIENELFHLQLNYRMNCNERYGLVLHRESQAACLQTTKSFKVSVLFEKEDGQHVSDVKSVTNVINNPQSLCNFNINDVRQTCGTCRPYSSYDSNWNRFKIICLFHGDFSSEFHSKEKNNTTRNGLEFPPNLKSLSLDLSNLLKNETLSDVNLKCGDHIIPAHRSVLAARSEVFAAMFQTKMKESNTGDVDIIDMEASVINLFLKYLYSGEISKVTDKVLPGLYTAADKYAVHDLKQSCRDLMMKRLSKENCINILILSDAHNDLIFKETVIAHICYNDEILEQPTWLLFTEEYSKLSIEVYKKYVELKRKAGKREYV